MTLLEEDDESKSRYLEKLKGIFFCICVGSIVVTPATCVQLLERNIPDFELNTCRFATSGILFTLGITCTTRQWPIIPKSEIISTFSLDFIVFLGTVTHYLAVTFIPLATAQSIFLISGIISGLILFAIFLEDKITILKLTLTVSCMCGVILVIQP